MMMNTATPHVRIVPAIVSHLPKEMSLTSSPLSTTALCWKKICHGAMVVPMLARTMNSSSGEKPSSCGRKNPSATFVHAGAVGVSIAQNAAGM